MSITGVLVSLLYLFLYIAVIILVAFAIKWAITYFIGGIDPDVYKWGRIVVGLLCLIAVVVWIVGLLGMAGPMPLFHNPALVR